MRQEAAGNVAVALAERGFDVVDGEAEAEQIVRTERDLVLPPFAAHRIDFANPFLRKDFASNVPIGEGAQVHRRRLVVFGVNRER